MKQTSTLYKEIIAGPHSWDLLLFLGERRLALGNETGEEITFGGEEIMVGIFDEENAYTIEDILSLTTKSNTFSQNTLQCGCCVAGELDASVLGNLDDLEQRASVRVYVRASNGIDESEWIPKGKYFIDTRKTKRSQHGDISTDITAYDAMLMFEEDYPESSLDWPARDIDVLREIANAFQISISHETEMALNRSFQINYPSGYSCREVASGIAAMYGGCFVINDYGELHFIDATNMPTVTVLGADGGILTVGGVAILA